MSNDAGDSSSRLSDALNEIFTRPREPDERRATEQVPVEQAPVGGSGDTVDGEAYVLPEIVPATADAPRLPDREIRPRTVDEPAAGAPPRPVADPNGPLPSSQAESPRTATAQAQPTQTTQPATSWSDHMSTPSVVATGQLRAPGRRPRVRRVTRVVRHIDPWSTFKVAILFTLVGYVVCLTSGVLLWRVAESTGTLDNIERWFTQFGWETFELDGSEIFHNAWIIGLFAVVAATGAAVLLVTLFNLVSDIVGGVRMTVLEEEVVERTISSTRRYVVRRPVETGVGGASTSEWSTDDLDDVDDARASDASRADRRVDDRTSDELPADGRVDDRTSDAGAATPGVDHAPVGAATTADSNGHDTQRRQAPAAADWSVD